jgi:hypothetical protein
MSTIAAAALIFFLMLGAEAAVTKSDRRAVLGVIHV